MHDAEGIEERPAAHDAAAAERDAPQGQAPTVPRGVPLALGVVSAVVFLGAYGLLAQLAEEIGAAGHGVSPWFPPVGLSLAAVLIAGRRAIPLIVLADALQLAVRDGGGAIDIVLLALLQGVVWGGVGLALRRRLSAAPPLSRMPDLGWFAFIGVLGGALLAAFTGSALLIALQDGDWADYGTLVRDYFVGDGIGILTVTPAVLAAAHVLRAGALPVTLRRAWSRPWETLLRIATTIAVPMVAVAAADGALLAVAPLPVAFVALRAGISGASLGVALWSLSGALAYRFWGDPSLVTLDEVAAALLSGGLLALCIGAVVSERERGRARLAYLALHDDLTGLPNHRGFMDVVGDALARRRAEPLAVLVVRFERLSVLAAAGTRALDAALVVAADRLAAATGADTTIARLGPGRFVLLVDGPGAAHAELLAERLLGVLEEPVVLRGHEHLLGPVIGIARAVAGEDPAAVVDHAARAAHRAGPVEGTAVFDDVMRAERAEREQLTDDLRRALEHGGLHLAFQPIVALRSGEVLGAEALVRWEHPSRGAVSPAQFIPVAEQCGLILPLGRWVLAEACRVARSWPEISDQPMVVHVNVSAVQLHDERFPGDVRAVLEATGLPPQQLCLELTESVMVDDLEVAIAAVQELDAIGVRVVLDDFGTGHSSLSWLQRLPVRALKIDRSFVAGVDSEAVDLAIVGATLGLASAMQLSSVAEGVETPQQLEALRALACPAVQGYLICRPVPELEFRRWLDDYTGGPLVSG